MEEGPELQLMPAAQPAMTDSASAAQDVPEEQEEEEQEVAAVPPKPQSMLLQVSWIWRHNILTPEEQAIRRLWTVQMKAAASTGGLPLPENVTGDHDIGGVPRLTLVSLRL